MSNRFSKQYIFETLGTALRQGVTPRELALTCALGLIMGIFPVMGTTTLLCFVLSVLLRLNIVVIQLVNYLVTPLQVLLILPLIKTGAYVFQLKPFVYSTEELAILFKNDFLTLMKESGIAIAGGVGIWVLVAIPLFLVSFYLFHYLLLKFIPPRKNDF